jgi:predicted lipoprotein
MRKSLLALLIALPLPALAAPMALHPTARGVVEGAIDNAIRPAFGRLAERSASLADAAKTLCAAPSADHLAEARTGFAGLVDAWSRAELVTIGPMADDHRAERFLFWPDRKGIALKQVQGLLADEDPTATDPATLKQKSVAVQGLGALEFALFGTGAETLTTGEGAYRCAYIVAAATGLATISGELDSAWRNDKGIADALTFPSPDRTDYRSSTEVLEELVGLLAHGTELVRDQRLLSFTGRDGAAPKPKSALFWRSGLTIAALRADFAGLRALFEGAELGAYVPDEAADVPQKVRAAFDAVDNAAAAVTLPIERALADPTQRAALDTLVAESKALQDLLSEDLPAALGLSVGFSSLDGD